MTEQLILQGQVLGKKNGVSIHGPCFLRKHLPREAPGFPGAAV